MNLSFELQNDWAGHKPDTKQTETVWCFLQRHPASLHHQRCRHGEAARSGHSRLLLRNVISECSAPHQIQYDSSASSAPYDQSLPVRRFRCPMVTLRWTTNLVLLKWDFGKCCRGCRGGFCSFILFLIEAYFLNQNCLPSSYFFSTFNLLKNKEQQPR